MEKEIASLEEWAKNIIQPKLFKARRLYSVALTNKRVAEIEELKIKVIIFYGECRRREEYGKYTKEDLMAFGVPEELKKELDNIVATADELFSNLVADM